MTNTIGGRWIHRHKNRRVKELTAYGRELFRECMRRVRKGENIAITIEFASRHRVGAYVET